MMKRLFFLLTALLTLSVGMRAQTQSVTYIDENGDEQTVDNVNVITNSSFQVTWGEAGQTTRYVVVNDVLISQGVICQGNVHLILADGAELRATGGDYHAGIQVSGEGNSLSIYGQAAQTGKLNATGGKSAAGIGGRKVGSGSNITINGGDVTATGGDGATGIGGGDGGSGSNITINGGNIHSTGGNHGAGIGGGWLGSGSNITINGGTVWANGGNFDAAGIGGGGGGSGSNITINGGNIHSTGGNHGAGIGGGLYGSGSNITINGGRVTANGGYNGGAGIGDGFGGSGSDSILVDTALQVIADGNNPPITVIENNGNDLASKLSGKQYVTIVNLIPYKKAATDAIDAAIVDVTDENILAIANAAKTNISNATTEEEIDSIKTLAVAKITALYQILIARQGIQNAEINSMINDAVSIISNATDTERITDAMLDAMTVIGLFQNGKAEGIEQGRADAFGSMAEPCTDCPSIEVTKGDKTIRLYSPEKVEFRKME